MIATIIPKQKRSPLNYDYMDGKEDDEDKGDDDDVSDDADVSDKMMIIVIRIRMMIMMTIEGIMLY